MLRKQAGKPAELPQHSTQKRLAYEDCAIVREMYTKIHQSTLDRFTYSFIDSLHKDLQAVIYRLDRLPEESFKKMIDVLHHLSRVRDEMRLARFLFDVEEIDPVYRLIMRNRAVLRGEHILDNTLHIWP